MVVAMIGGIAHFMFSSAFDLKNPLADMAATMKKMYTEMALAKP